MTTAAERLLQLAGAPGTAAALLLAIGQGLTTGEALVAYSGTAGMTAGEHLLSDGLHPILVDRELLQPVAVKGLAGRRRRLSGRDEARRRALRKADEEIVLLLM